MPSVIQHTHKLNHPEILSDVIHKIPMHKEDSERQWIFWGPIFQLQKFGDEPYLLLEPMGCGCVHFSSFPSKLHSLLAWLVAYISLARLCVCRIFLCFLCLVAWLLLEVWRRSSKNIVWPWLVGRLVRPVVDAADLPWGFSKQRMCICICKKKETRKTYRDDQTDIRWMIIFWIIVQSYSLSGIFFL